MKTNFIRKHWVYFILLGFIVLANVAPRMTPEEEEVVLETTEQPGVFLDLQEAGEKSERIQKIIEEDTPLYLLYIALNLSVVFLFFLGLYIDGYIVLQRRKNREVFKRTNFFPAPEWKIPDVARIVILAVSLSYAFFILLSFCMGALESMTGARFHIFDAQNFRMIFDTIVLDLCILLVILKFMQRMKVNGLEVFGLQKKGLGQNIVYGAMGYAAVMPVILVIGVVIYAILNLLNLRPPPQPIVGLFLAEKNTALIVLSSLIAAVFGPIIEEIFFRGVMYNAVKRKAGVFWGILVTSVLFSFLHTHAASYFLVGFIPIAILGAALAYLYEKTGSLIPSMTLHVLNNVGSVAMVFVFKYFNSLAG